MYSDYWLGATQKHDLETKISPELLRGKESDKALRKTTVVLKSPLVMVDNFSVGADRLE